MKADSRAAQKADSLVVPMAAMKADLRADLKAGYWAGYLVDH